MFKQKSNRGSLLVEAIVVLGLIATFTPLLYKHVSDRRNDIDNINRANTLLYLQQKTEEWLADPNNATTQTLAANNAKTTITPSTISTGLAKFDGKYIIGIRREDVNGSPTYKALIVDKTDSGSDLKAGKVANLIGTSAGIYSAMDSVNAWGVNGVWKEQISNYFTNTTDVRPGSVVVSTEYSRTKEQTRLSDLLIDTDLDMGDYDIATTGDIKGGTVIGGTVTAENKFCIGADCVNSMSDMASGSECSTSADCVTKYGATKEYCLWGVCTSDNKCSSDSSCPTTASVCVDGACYTDVCKGCATGSICDLASKQCESCSTSSYVSVRSWMNGWQNYSNCPDGQYMADSNTSTLCPNPKGCKALPAMTTANFYYDKVDSGIGSSIKFFYAANVSWWEANEFCEKLASAYTKSKCGADEACIRPGDTLKVPDNYACFIGTDGNSLSALGTRIKTNPNGSGNGTGGITFFTNRAFAEPYQVASVNFASTGYEASDRMDTDYVLCHSIQSYCDDLNPCANGYSCYGGRCQDTTSSGGSGSGSSSSGGSSTNYGENVTTDITATWWSGDGLDSTYTVCWDFETNAWYAISDTTMSWSDYLDNACKGLFPNGAQMQKVSYPNGTTGWHSLPATGYAGTRTWTNVCNISEKLWLGAPNRSFDSSNNTLADATVASFRALCSSKPYTSIYPSPLLSKSNFTCCKWYTDTGSLRNICISSDSMTWSSAQSACSGIGMSPQGGRSTPAYWSNTTDGDGHILSSICGNTGAQVWLGYSSSTYWVVNLQSGGSMGYDYNGDHLFLALCVSN